LDLIFQDQRDIQAAKAFLGKLLVNYDVLGVIYTDKF